MTAGASALTLERLPEILAVARLEADAAIPEWAVGGPGFRSITRTGGELSIVAEDVRVPADVMAERGWAVLRVRGPLPFHLTGILAAMASPLAAAGIPVFVVSTFDTDYLLVKETRVDEACEVLRRAGHGVLVPTPPVP